MSETLPTTDEPVYGDPVVKSEISSPLNPDSASEPKPEPDPKPAEPDVKKAEPEPKPRGENPYDTRIRQLTAKTADALRRADALEAENARLRQTSTPTDPAQVPAAPGVKSQAEYDRDVQAAAVKLKAEGEFNAACNKIADEGNAAFKEDFQPTLTSLWNVVEGFDAQGNLTPQGRSLIEAAQETDTPAAVLHHLGKNLNDALRIVAMTPAKMGAAVAKLSNTLAAQASAPPATSKAPPPVEPVTGASRNTPSLADMPMPEFIKTRDAQIKAKNAR